MRTYNEYSHKGEMNASQALYNRKQYSNYP